MGIYTTTTALQVLMIGLEFDTATSSLADALIVHAENEVNKYLSKRYNISSFQTSVPPLVKSLTETLAEGYIYQRNSRGGLDAKNRGEILIKQAIENLTLIQQYKVDLIDSSGSVIADSDDTAYRVLCNTSDYSNTFNEDSDLEWKVSTSKLDDIFNERE